MQGGACLIVVVRFRAGSGFLRRLQAPTKSGIYRGSLHEFIALS
jgi:hypothetical protein